MLANDNVYDRIRVKKRHQLSASTFVCFNTSLLPVYATTHVQYYVQRRTYTEANRDCCLG